MHGEGVSGNMLVFPRVKSITRQIRVYMLVVGSLSRFGALIQLYAMLSFLILGRCEIIPVFEGCGPVYTAKMRFSSRRNMCACR